MAASATSLAAVTPAEVAGVTNVVVTKADGQAATLPGVFTYTQSMPPAVTSISPTSATHGGGTPVTITGTGFVAGATVRFGATAATSASVANSTTITATAPAGIVNALVSISVTNADSQSGTLASVFRFVDTGTVTVTAVAPNGGPLEGATAITITGTNFNAGATVKLGDTAGTVSSVTSNSIVVLSPVKAAAGKVTVTVTNTDAKAGTLKDSFTYQKAPTLTAITTAARASTAGGTSASLSGTGFIEGMTVFVNGVATTDVKIAGATKVTFAAPVGEAGLAGVTVRNPDNQTAAVAGAVFYVAPPTISGIAPNSGDEAGGNEVLILGDGFTSGTAVTFGGKAATNITLPDTGRLVMKAPAGAAGFVDVVVTVEGLIATKASGYFYSTAKGKVLGAIAAKRISLAMFGGGTTQAIVTSTTGAGCTAPSMAMWVIEVGKFVGYIGGAPAIVNADWEKKFATGIPANTPVIIRCG